MVQNITLDTSLFPKELDLLLGILKLNNYSSYIENNSHLLDNIDWDKFVDLTIHHRVFPLIYKEFKKYEKSIVPDRIMQRLEHYYTNNTFNMLALTAEMGNVCQAFSDNNIQALVLKGPVLAESLYGNISDRTSKDLDILVPIDSINKVKTILTEYGYILDKNQPWILDDWKWKYHHLSYYHPEKKVQIEIHWRLSPEMGKEPSFDELWKRRKVSDLTDGPVYLLGSEDLLFYLMNHGFRHAWFRLRWLVDINRLLSKELNPYIVDSLLNKYDAKVMAGQGIMLTSELLHKDVKYKFESLISSVQKQKKASQLAVYFINKGLVPHSRDNPKEFVKKYHNYLLLQRSINQRLLLLLSRLYPSSWDAEILPLPKQLNFLYFPLRPFLWLIRQIKKRTSTTHG
ncbi:nucleotidyltransferase family protein [Aquibacillus albus]|uniref:Renal dipeptidase n=1 Tax=Aquibacillus albus TaxID=1168171 RepID=A0ABS2N5V1_9BACI|nr:nucleotidyltransferase family protein [Aquibacillus albus]MBM7573497.1 hypothetical protein [Aquibacillus albus]